MNNSRADVRGSPPSPALPADHVLMSGAVIFPGAFDQNGCPLLVFPVETQSKLSEEISTEDVSHFILYCLRLHNKRGEEGLVSVVADLRQADITIVKFIAETLLRLEFYRRIIHSVYIVQPKKRSVQKQLMKLLTPSTKHNRTVLFQRVFLKDVCELSNFVDRSQLTCRLGGYLIYCHDSWVNFIKEIDVFVQEFLCVVNRLPSCISTLQSLAKLPVPADFERLREFCLVNEARFQQLRRDLGLDDLLKRCVGLLEKLRCPENDPCFRAMAGTILFCQTTLEMLQNYNRLSAAVEKVELLWQQAFSKPRLQLQVTHLRREAQQIQEEMIMLHGEKVQPFRIQAAEDIHRAESVRLEFQSSVYKQAMDLVRRAEEVIHKFTESDRLTDFREPWVDDLHRMKENLSSSVQHLYQTLRNMSDFHYTLNRCEDWYSRVLSETFLSDLSRRRNGLCESSFSPEGLMWRRGVDTFLGRNPGPEVHELVKLTHLSNVLTDPYLQHTGKQLSHRCMTLRRLLSCPGSVPLRDLQLALQWQYEYLTSNHKTSDITSPQTDQNKSNISFMSNSVPHRHLLSQCESLNDLAKWSSIGDYHRTCGASAGKAPSLSSFDSGFDGAGSSHLDTRNRKEGFPGHADSKPVYAQIHEENMVSVSDSDDPREDAESRFNTQASIQIVPKITSDSVNLEIKVKRSATLPKNPWLSLPIDDLESSYTVTITPNSSVQQRIVKSPVLSTNTCNTERSHPAQTHEPRCVSDEDPFIQDPEASVLQREDSFDDSELNPIIKVLSSTITDHEDKASCTVDAEASLLWDTFDLHNLRHDSCERLDASLCDWVQREHQELQEVEKTLERAAEILQEEENVLEQEVMLNVLLETEAVYKHCLVWNEDQHSEISPQDLLKSGVIGLDDISSVSPRSEFSFSGPEAETIENDTNSSSSHESAIESRTSVDGLVQQKVNRHDILQDLQVLEEQILEESLKLESLRLSDVTEVDISESVPLSYVTSHSPCEERLMNLAHLKEEKMDVDVIKIGRNEGMKKSSSHKVVRCSIMKNSRKVLSASDTEEQLLCADTSHLPEKGTRQSSQDEDEEFSLIMGTEVTNQSEPRSPESKFQPVSFQNCHEIDCSVLSHSYGAVSSDSFHSERSQDPLVNNISSTDCGHIVDNAVDQVNKSLVDSQKTNPEQGTFDPGGVLTLLPAHTSVNYTQTQQNSAPIDESVLTSNEFTNQLQVRCLQGIHMHNNNNNKNSFLHIEHSENQTNNSTVIPYREARASLKTKSEESGQIFGCERTEPDVSYDGGGSMRAVCESLLDQTHPNMSSRPHVDCKTPIVLDTGSGLMKAGFADQDLPTLVFPTVIGHPKYEEVMSGGVDRDVYVGHDAQHMRGVLTLKHPIRNGIVRNWEEMEMIWHHTYQQLSVDPRDHPVLLTEAARNPLENRQRMIELMFETFNVPLTFVAMQAVLALYASGRTTGVVLDSGDGVSHSVPVFDGYCLPHAVQRFNLAGADVTLQLQKLLLEQGVCMRTSAELEIVREMKEKCCCVALDYESELRNGGPASSEVQYTLPDGRIVALHTQRFRAPEVLFKPELIGQDHYGMHETVFKSILQSDIDLRRSFLGNIILSGGNTLLSGLPERLQMEIRHMVPADLMESVRVTSPSDRDFSVWCGGAVMANLPTFSSAWISSEEYEEFGPQIVFRKCF